MARGRASPRSGQGEVPAALRAFWEGGGLGGGGGVPSAAPHPHGAPPASSLAKSISLDSGAQQLAFHSHQQQQQVRRP